MFEHVLWRQCIPAKIHILKKQDANCLKRQGSISGMQEEKCPEGKGGRIF
jgi:hypothetical protein